MGCPIWWTGSRSDEQDPTRPMYGLSSGRYFCLKTRKKTQPNPKIMHKKIRFYSIWLDHVSSWTGLEPKEKTCRFFLIQLKPDLTRQMMRTIWDGKEWEVGPSRRDITTLSTHLLNKHSFPSNSWRRHCLTFKSVITKSCILRAWPLGYRHSCGQL